MIENQFRTAVKSLGGGYFYEYKLSLHKENTWETPKQKTIDFVVYWSSRRRNVQSYVGVEIKTTLSDLAYSSYGKNFFSFAFNYLLVPESICARASKYLNEVPEYKHVGLIVACEDGSFILQKRASTLRDCSIFDVQYNLELEQNDIAAFDTIEYLFTSYPLLLTTENREAVAALVDGANERETSFSEYIRWLIEKEREAQNGREI